MILFLTRDAHTTGPPVQRFPNFQEHSLAILAPLMIPEPQLFDALCRKERSAFLIALQLLRHSVLKPVQLHGQLRRRTVKIQEVGTLGMLSAEFEASEASRLQGSPKFLLLVRLLAPQSPGDAGRIHANESNRIDGA